MEGARENQLRATVECRATVENVAKLLGGGGKKATVGSRAPRPPPNPSHTRAYTLTHSHTPFHPGTNNQPPGPLLRAPRPPPIVILWLHHCIDDSKVDSKTGPIFRAFVIDSFFESNSAVCSLFLSHTPVNNQASQKCIVDSELYGEFLRSLIS